MVLDGKVLFFSATNKPKSPAKAIKTIMAIFNAIVLSVDGVDSVLGSRVSSGGTTSGSGAGIKVKGFGWFSIEKGETSHSLT